MSTPPIYDPRKGLNKASVDLREPTPVDSRDKATVRSMVVPFVEVLIEDLNNRWGGGGKNVLICREGKRRQPQRFQPEQLMANKLNPRTKNYTAMRITSTRDSEQSHFGGLRKLGCEEGGPGKRHSIPCSVSVWTCSPYHIFLGLQASQDRLYGSIHGAQRQIVKRFLAPLILGCCRGGR